MKTASYHITGETETHFFEAEVEQNYRYDSEEQTCVPVGDPQFFEIKITDKATNLTTEEDEMPDSILNIALDKSDEAFPYNDL